MIATHEPISPTQRESELARESSRQLARFGKKNLRIQVPEVDDPIVLPAAAVQLLIALLTEMAEGNAVTLYPIHAELTTQQAADLLGVSRPFLIKQLDGKKIPFHKVGTHRRILFKDLMKFKQQIDRKRLKALEELAAQGQELDMGY
ncbi:MAG: helix-turn-helix domain-containing protein [Phycisphaera sp.]|nr:helix-turn-helix domain-containing protein [Phycisphaera sp.]